MNVNRITGYNVFTSNSTSGVSLLLQSGERTKLTATDPAQILLWVDILRNEDPVYYNTKSGMLYTGEEETGEGE